MDLYITVVAKPKLVQTALYTRNNNKDVGKDLCYKSMELNKFNFYKLLSPLWQKVNYIINLACWNKGLSLNMYINCQFRKSFLVYFLNLCSRFKSYSCVCFLTFCSTNHSLLPLNSIFKFIYMLFNSMLFTIHTIGMYNM